jgi:hypothetical protein
MVKYWLPDGKVLTMGWVNYGPEMLLESFGEKKNTNGWMYRQNCSLSEVL